MKENNLELICAAISPSCGKVDFLIGATRVLAITKEISCLC